MIAEIKRIIKESEIMKEDDAKWPQKNRDGRQELEIRLGNEHISFEVSLRTGLGRQMMLTGQRRLLRLVLWWMLQNQRILKVSEYFIIWYKT